MAKIKRQVKGEKLGKSEITVYLDEDLALWLEGKALEGYKKASFIRGVLQREKELEEDAREFADGSKSAQEEMGGDDADAGLFGDEDE
ncbi:MAG: hypothetical protein KGH49_04085 [Candidatus Micrarchaeota archaeon]|nr:hypothetical protein [Candidatus Micrarchaeota archaeon]